MQPLMSPNLSVHEGRAKRCRIDDPRYGLGPPLEVAVRKVGHHQAPSGLRCGATGVFKRIIKGLNRSALDGRAMHRSQTGNR